MYEYLMMKLYLPFYESFETKITLPIFGERDHLGDPGVDGRIIL